MKHAYLCLFAEEDGEFAVFIPDLPGCCTVGDDLPEARQMAKEVMTLWIEVTADRGDIAPKPKMSTFAEAVEWFRELMSYELEGETEEDRAFNEDDLHVEMIEVEVSLPSPAPR